MNLLMVTILFDTIRPYTSHSDFAWNKIIDRSPLNRTRHRHATFVGVPSCVKRIFVLFYAKTAYCIANNESWLICKYYLVPIIIQILFSSLEARLDAIVFQQRFLQCWSIIDFFFSIFDGWCWRMSEYYVAVTSRELLAGTSSVFHGTSRWSLDLASL